MKTMQAQNMASGVELSFSDDCTEVYVCIKNPAMPYDHETILKYLSDIDVTTGIKDDEIDKMLSEKNPTKLYTVAESQKPVDGKDGWFEMFFDTDMLAKPKILKDGSVDYSEYGDVPFVEEGDRIALYHPATESSDGVNFRGETMVAKKGKDLAKLKGKGFLVKDNEYFAKTSGRVTYKDGRLLVENELLIEGDVSLATGDINFSGNIHIRGDILTGTIIASAKGSIIADGYVEACEIYAGADVVLKNGMQGNGKGKIIAGGTVSGKFFEQVTISAGMDVCANAILNSNITAVRDITVSGKFGIIIGGTLSAEHQITSTIIGNMSEVKTVLKVGKEEDLFAVLLKKEKEKEGIEKDLDKIAATLRKIEPLMAQGKREDLSMEKVRLLRSKIELETRLNENAKQKQSVMDQISRCNSARIRVQKALYPGTRVTMNGVSTIITEEAYDASITVKGSVIEIS